jgi:hypothetical protein
MARKNLKIVINPAATKKQRKPANSKETAADETKKKRKRQKSQPNKKINRKVPTIPDNYLNFNYKMKEFVYDINKAADQLLNHDNQITFHGRAIGERVKSNGRKQILVEWFPTQM